MSTLKEACAVLTTEGAQALADMGHLFDGSIYGPLLCCESIDVDGEFLTLQLAMGQSPIYMLVPVRYIRAIFKTADLIRLDIYSGNTTRPLPLGEKDLLDAVRLDFAKFSIPKGTEIPLELLRSLYATTPSGLMDRVIAILEGEGFLERQADGKVVKA